MRWATGVAMSLLFCLACGGGRDRLLADLQSPRAHERAMAIKKLGQIGRAEDVVLFTKAAKDPAATVRAEAAVALGKSQDIRAVDLLGDLLGDSDEQVQAKAAVALAEIKGEKAKAYLILQYGRRGRSTRQTIIEALKLAKVPNAVTEVVTAEAKSLWDRNWKALNEGALAEQVAAAEELGKSGRADAIARLLPLIHDRQVVLAAAAVRGLGYTRDARAAAPIAELLSENFRELRESACQALAQLGSQDALPQLKEVATEKSTTSPIALRAILAGAASADSNKTLCEVILDAAPAEALAAGREMRSRGGCSLEPIVARLGKSKDANVVASALIAVQALGPLAKDVRPRVIPLLSHSDSQIRRLSLEALAELGDPSAQEPMQTAYERELKALEPLRVRWIAAELPQSPAPGFDPNAPSGPGGEGDAQYLARFGELLTRVREARLLRAKTQPRPMVAPKPPTEIAEDVSADQLRVFAAALKGLGKLKNPGAREVLLKYKRDPLPAIRTAAYVGLAFLGGPGPNDAREGLADADREVVSATAEALAESGEAGQLTVLHALSVLPGERSTLLNAVDRVPLSRAAVASLLPLISEGGPEVAIAARILGELRAKEAVEPLKKYLEVPTAAARREALLALGHIGEASAAETVVRDLYSDVPDVRAAAAEAVSRLGATTAAELVAALRGDYYKRVRDSATLALSRLGPTPEAKK